MIEGKGNFGYNAATDTYEDLVKAGVIDPTKVTRTALQNAASVATLLLTSDALIAEKPKDAQEGRRRRPRRRLRHVLNRDFWDRWAARQRPNDVPHVHRTAICKSRSRSGSFFVRLRNPAISPSRKHDLRVNLQG